MFVIRMAELNILIKNKYDYIENFCGDYIIFSDKTDFVVSVTDEDIEKERNSPEDFSGYLESLAVYRKIAEKIINYDAFLLHGAVLNYEKTGIAFLAKSGTGKSTHIMLWKQLFKDKVTVINGDKPIIRRINGGFYACGTPWAGKERWQTNSRVLLKKICFLERGTENQIKQEDKSQILQSLLKQVYMEEKNVKYLLMLFELLDEFIKNADFYRLRCNMNIDAAELANRGMLK